MAKTKTTPITTSPSVVDRGTEIQLLRKELDELQEHSKAVTQLKLLVDEQAQRIGSLTSTIKTLMKTSKTEVSQIDSDIAFQKCLEIAMITVMSKENIYDLSRKDSYMKSMIQSTIDVAQALHDGLCDHFAIEIPTG